jgi:hypothetical protein
MSTPKLTAAQVALLRAVVAGQVANMGGPTFYGRARAARRGPDLTSSAPRDSKNNSPDWRHDARPPGASTRTGQGIPRAIVDADCDVRLGGS